MLTRTAHPQHGYDCIRLTLDEYVLHSPPIPTDRAAYLNGDVREVRAQKFTYTALPTRKEYEAWPPDRQQRLLNQEWERRLNGVWFFNCGEPTYLTGNHYYYLNYHRYDKGAKPQYRQANLEFFWVWQFCLESENCFGLYLHTRRRDGKTSRAASIGLEAATRVASFKFGIASKTDVSARDSVFRDEVQRPLKALRSCPWFMPKLKSKIDPLNNIVFGSASTTARAAQDEETELDDIDSSIVWFLPNENAIDSGGLDFFLNDEVAKKQAFDAYARWMTVRPQMIPDGAIVGKSINATTTDRAKESAGAGEDGEDGGVDQASTRAVAQARKFFRTSNHLALVGGDSLEEKMQALRALPASSTTESGLFRLFVPAYKGMLPDEYGRDTVAGRQHFERLRAPLKGVALINQQRENPFTAEEALQDQADENSEFNATHIKDNLEAIDEYEERTGKKLVRRYRLEWKNPLTWEPPVRAIPDEKGDWEFSWLPPVEELNQMLPLSYVQDKSGRYWRSYKPLNVNATSIGVDPVQRRKSSLNDQKRASQYAIAVFRPLDPHVERQRLAPSYPYWPSNAFIGRYNARPENANTANEELFKACYLFGCEASVEKTTADATFELAEERGFSECMADKPQLLETDTNKGQNGPGTAASAPNTDRMARQFSQFFTDYVGSAHTENSRGQLGVNDEGVPYDFRRKPFRASLEDNKLFDIRDTKKSDDTMAEMYAYNHARRFDRMVAVDVQDEYGEAGLDPALFNPTEYFS